MCDTYSIYEAAREVILTELLVLAKENGLVDRERDWFEGEAMSLAEEITRKSVVKSTQYPYSELLKKNV